jgi:uncharacterized protein YkwD
VTVDHFALLVHDIVVLEQLFADFEIVGFHLLLRIRDRAAPAAEAVTPAARLLAALLLLGLGSAAEAQSCTADTRVSAPVIDAANALRRQASAAPLVASDTLKKAAAAHACDMARNGFFDHRGSDGSTMMTRIRRAGCRPTIAAENIAYGYRDAGKVLAGWRDSPGHRKNLLLPKARQAGVAKAEGRGQTYWVMVFAAGC